MYLCYRPSKIVTASVSWFFISISSSLGGPALPLFTKKCAAQFDQASPNFQLVIIHRPLLAPQHPGPLSVKKYLYESFSLGFSITSCQHFFFFIIFSCIFILLSRESDQSTIQARLGVASYLSTTPRCKNLAKCLSQRYNK